MRIGSKSLFVEERIHFGKWDIDVENEKVFYKNEELEILETQGEILAFLMSSEGICFSELEIAYALDLKEFEIQIGSLIIRKVGEPYLFEEVID
jgi:DNA-binding response OmpR family regulator